MVVFLRIQPGQVPEEPQPEGLDPFRDWQAACSAPNRLWCTRSEGFSAVAYHIIAKLMEILDNTPTVSQLVKDGQRLFCLAEWIKRKSLPLSPLRNLD